MIAAVKLAVLFATGITDCLACAGCLAACAVAVFIAVTAFNGAVACMCVITV